ncbi:MAG: glycosyltransferase family 1 protein [Candidatus Acididesulfobacter diazotrophicus]|jgi:glycosyltransferase involved in cell wall biosynthesis|uniref:Glycosyltransferase family 1 protein n=1 Tax=Candidatus Acididesulfobacter diazotrophicus TaxID=2597226 RepID=A0A519BKG1_9DELT|nr:MAG: glycosyltransferase family 1 protein [Candidatus Acididesulfobacter diazotrophicus]
MKICVFFGANIKTGGGFQYNSKIINILKSINNDNFEFIYFADKKVVDSYKDLEIKVEAIKLNYLDKLSLRIRKFLKIYLKKFDFLDKLFKNKIETIFKKFDIDLIYFLEPTSIALYIENINYIFTVWDIAHRDFMEFPEVRSNFEFEIREKIYINSLKKAIAVLSESYLGKQNIIRRYGIDEKRVYVAQFTPTLQSIGEQKFIDIKNKFNIKNDYIYYPAQFWPHKNHVYILDAMKILKETFNIIIDVVFTGFNYGNLNYILDYSKKIGIREQIHYLGFVDKELIPNLYKQSLALVMPTYFGPTNLPPLEAFSLGVPVFYSDLEGLREQVGNAAILININDPQDLAFKLIKLIKGEISKDKLIEHGKKKLREWTNNDFANIIIDILNNYKIKLKCWKDI